MYTTDEILQQIVDCNRAFYVCINEPDYLEAAKRFADLGLGSYSLINRQIVVNISANTKLKSNPKLEDWLPEDEKD